MFPTCRAEGSCLGLTVAVHALSSDSTTLLLAHKLCNPAWVSTLLHVSNLLRVTFSQCSDLRAADSAMKGLFCAVLAACMLFSRVRQDRQIQLHRRKTAKLSAGTSSNSCRSAAISHGGQSRVGSCALWLGRWAHKQARGAAKAGNLNTEVTES